MERNSDILAKLKTMNIQGKPYVTVPARIEAFWSMCPAGQILTECLVDTAERCMFKATVLDETGKVIATGHASEKPNTPMNKTSMLENCETSAIGRALGIAGIGSLESIASAEEVMGALSARETPARAAQTPSKAQSSLKPTQTTTKELEDRMKALLRQCANAGLDVKAIGSRVSAEIGKKSVQFQAEDYRRAIAIIEDTLKEAEKIGNE